MNPILPSLIRGVHDVSSALWAGGLLVLALVILPTARRQEGLAMARAIQDRLRRFVWPAMVILTVTGILMVRMQVNAGSLLSAPGPYKTIFIIKLVTVGAMIVIAAVRQYLMFGKKVSGKSPAVLLFANVLLAVTTLMLSGSLTVLANAAQRGGNVPV